jgi:hypothetical protein
MTEYALVGSHTAFNSIRGKRPLLCHLDIEMTEWCKNRYIHRLINHPKDEREGKVREMETFFARPSQADTRLGCMTVRLTGKNSWSIWIWSNCSINPLHTEMVRMLAQNPELHFGYAGVLW